MMRAAATLSLATVVIAALALATACEKPILDEGTAVSGSPADGYGIVQSKQTGPPPACGPW